jgi:hypothetical protein
MASHTPVHAPAPAAAPAMDLDAHGSSASSDVNNSASYPPPERVSGGAHISSMEQYKALYDRSITDPTGFWGEQARKELSWFRDFREV